jgi:hypothetical protein
MDSEEKFTTTDSMNEDLVLELAEMGIAPGHANFLRRPSNGPCRPFKATSSSGQIARWQAEEECCTPMSSNKDNHKRRTPTTAKRSFHLSTWTGERLSASFATVAEAISAIRGVIGVPAFHIWVARG